MMAKGALAHRQGRWGTAQREAWTDTDVRTIVRVLLAEKSTSLVKFAKKVALGVGVPPKAARAGLLSPAHLTQPSLLKAADDICDAWAGIQARVTSERALKRRRGALLERFVYEAVRSREPDTFPERLVDLPLHPHSGNTTTSSPQDVVADGERWFEIYECKRLPFSRIDTGEIVGLTQADIYELADAYVSGSAEGGDIRPTVAILEDYISLTWTGELSTLKTPEPLYYASVDELLELRDRPSDRQFDT